MAPIVAPEVVRISVIQSFQGREVANVIDYNVTPEASGLSRAEAAEIQARIVGEAWANNILPLQSNLLQLTEVRWVDLDSLSGSTGSTTDFGLIAAPLPGTGGTSPMPGNVSVLVTKLAPSGGRRRRQGRLYMAGAGESATDASVANTLATTAQAAVQAGFNGFYDDTTEDTSSTGVAKVEMVIVHTINEGTPTAPDIVYDGQSLVSGLQVQSLLATQRRRLRG